jgi:hypothetical protein
VTASGGNSGGKYDGNRNVNAQSNIDDVDIANQMNAGDRDDMSGSGGGGM